MIRLGLALLAALIAFLIALHPVDALASRAHPPAACQLFGGQWDIWHGWRCA